MELALSLEKLTNEKLLHLHEVEKPYILFDFVHICVFFVLYIFFKTFVVYIENFLLF